ncbi:uncharacterized protein LOC116655234 [Drosophila ananassae]|nr:uncharacterized protein LOC116655222 [Drosophila ananassae]XP_032308660.1 uncharacterized protein LOC116655222 [Drosophila ananassae]XP_032308675.1 uncharacterized protein LOC116655234 [Drosophila ananassae]XP_044572446.1 uncharacterized protein LOC116655234 [Drosophila ananassae]
MCKPLFTCKIALRIEWGISPYIVWWPDLEKKNFLKKVEKILRAAAICICAVLRSTPNEALNAILSIPNPGLAGIELAKEAAIRLRKTQQWSTLNKGQSTILLNDPLLYGNTD